MVKIIPPLSATQCKQLRYNQTEKKLNYLRDGRGLYLEALRSGRKVWRFEFWLDGKKSRITLAHDYGTDGGSLLAARQWGQEQRSLVTEGISPNRHARQETARRRAKKQNTFNAIADEWLEHHKDRWSDAYNRQVESIVRRVLREPLGDRAINDIEPTDILAALESAQKRGTSYTAQKALELTSQIYRRAIVRQLVTYDPTYSLRGSEGLIRCHEDCGRAGTVVDPICYAAILGSLNGG